MCIHIYIYIYILLLLLSPKGHRPRRHVFGRGRDGPLRGGAGVTDGVGTPQPKF